MDVGRGSDRYAYMGPVGKWRRHIAPTPRWVEVQARNEKVRGTWKRFQPACVYLIKYLANPRFHWGGERSPLCDGVTSSVFPYTLRYSTELNGSFPDRCLGG